MKNCFYQLLLALIILLPGRVGAVVNERPFVIPELREWKGGEGVFTPSAGTRICVGKEAALLRIGKQFARDYELMFNQKLEVVQGKPAAGDFVFTLKADKKLGKEGYTLKISDRVTVTAPDTAGIFWATRTILQLSEQQKSRVLPQGTARDYPDYAVRGFMLDCGRKFIPMHFLRDYVKIMAYYKMNTFQIHLNDNAFKQYFEHDYSKTNAAFRLECDTYPGLTAQDGYYTKKEFIELQKLAESLGVEIIPEIDVPAHSLAFTQYKPEIGRRNMAWITLICLTLKRIPSWTDCCANIWREMSLFLEGSGYISAPTNILIRRKRWLKSSAILPITISVL